MNLYQQLADKVKELTVFCIEHRGKCFAELDAAKLFRYVAFQLLSGGLFIGHNPDGSVGLVLIGWPDRANDVSRRERDGTPHFTWLMPSSDGDAFFIGGVVGNVRLLPEVLNKVSGAWPDSPRKRLFTYRHNRLVELTWQTVERLTCYGQPFNS